MAELQSDIQRLQTEINQKKTLWEQTRNQLDALKVCLSVFRRIVVYFNVLPAAARGKPQPRSIRFKQVEE